MEPVSTAWSIDGNQSPRSIWCVGLSLCRRQISRFSGVQLNCTGSGVIRRGVSVWRVNSPAKMCPPPLPRTSRISPSCGNSSTSRTNSATNVPGSWTLKVKMRRWPKVPDAVTTLRARNTRGMVDGHLLPRGGGFGRELQGQVAERLLDRPRRVQERAGPPDLVGVQVQAHRGGRRGDGPGVGERRRVTGHQPGLAQLPPDAVGVQVADG